MSALILLGGGGHCSSVIDSIRAGQLYSIAGIIDVAAKIGEAVNGIRIIGDDGQLSSQRAAGVAQAFVTVGSVGCTDLRRSISHSAKGLGFRFPPIIDPSAVVSPSARISDGVFIGKGAIVNANAEIGEHAIINSGAIVEHGCRIGSFCHVAPGAVLCGNVVVGESSHIGANATVIQSLRIGAYAVIGAGSVVVRDVGDHAVAYGNPCRVEKLGHE